jgi:hypothetical protein
LHQLIEDGEIMRRREANNGGARVELDAHAPSAISVALGSK